MLSFLWKICDIIVLIGIVLNSQILKNNLTIWSHWSNNNNNRWIIIHFRREKGFCRLCYYAAEKTDFQISGEKYFELYWLSSVNTKASRPYPYMEEGRILYVSVHLCVCPSMCLSIYVSVHLCCRKRCISYERMDQFGKTFRAY